MKTYVYLWQYFSEILQNEKCCKQKMYRKSKHILYAITIFFRKYSILWDNVEERCRPGQAADDIMVCEHSQLDTQGYRHILKICNTYRFSTATTVRLTRRNVTIHILCLLCVNIAVLPIPLSFIPQSIPRLFQNQLLFFWCRIHLWFRLMGGLQAKSMTSQRYRAVTSWRICVTMATLWQQQDGGYALLFYIFNSTVIDWTFCD